MPRLSYANVVATLALFLALGGTSYAALTITGKNIKNGTITHKDIKRGSVGLDRLKGTIKNGAPGAPGSSGGLTVDAYTRAQSDDRFLGKGATAANADKVGGKSPSEFVAAGGELRVDNPAGWYDIAGTTWNANVMPTPERSYFRYEANAPGQGTLTTTSQIPVTANGKALTLRRAEMCYALGDANAQVDKITTKVLRRATGVEMTTADAAVDTTVRKGGKGCPAQEMAVALQPGDIVVMEVHVTWFGGGGTGVSLGTTSYVLN